MAIGDSDPVAFRRETLRSGGVEWRTWWGYTAGIFVAIVERRSECHGMNAI